MQNCFHLCATVVAGLFLLNMAGATAQTGAAPPPTVQPVPPAVQPVPPADWSKRAVIASVKVPETDVSELLGLHMWQFDITGTKPTHSVTCTLEVQEKGKPSRVLAEGGFEPQEWPQDGHLSVFIGQRPLEDSQGVSTKSVYEMRVSPLNVDAQVDQKGVTLFYTLKDPLKGTAVVATATQYNPPRRPDGTFVLGYAQKTIRPLKSPGDVALVFRVEEETN